MNYLFFILILFKFFYILSALGSSSPEEQEIIRAHSPFQFSFCEEQTSLYEGQTYREQLKNTFKNFRKTLDHICCQDTRQTSTKEENIDVCLGERCLYKKKD